jgi:hypothetical protein
MVPAGACFLHDIAYASIYTLPAMIHDTLRYTHPQLKAAVFAAFLLRLFCISSGASLDAVGHAARPRNRIAFKRSQTFENFMMSPAGSNLHNTLYALYIWGV